MEANHVIGKRGKSRDKWRVARQMTNAIDNRGEIAGVCGWGDDFIQNELELGGPRDAKNRHIADYFHLYNHPICGQKCCGGFRIARIDGRGLPEKAQRSAGRPPWGDSRAGRQDA